MNPSFNKEGFNQGITLFLDIHGDRSFLVPPSYATRFFCEMVFRSISKTISDTGSLGPGDLYSCDLVDDVNVPYVAFGSSQAVRMNIYKRETMFGQVEHIVEELIPDQNTFAVWPGEITLQIIQEQAGLILIDLYLRGAFASYPGTHLFDKTPVNRWLRSAVMNSFNKNDWKDMRCLFYRYLMYCGFAPVDKHCSIVKEMIPDEPVLTRLAGRLLKITGLNDAWLHSELKSRGFEESEVLNPLKIAQDFLRFNNRDHK